MRYLAGSQTNDSALSCSRFTSHFGKTAGGLGICIMAEETSLPGLLQELWSRMLWPRACARTSLSASWRSAFTVYRRSLRANFFTSIMWSLKNRLSVSLTCLMYILYSQVITCPRWHLALGPLSHTALPWQKLGTNDPVSNSDNHKPSPKSPWIGSINHSQMGGLRHF